MLEDQVPVRVINHRTLRKTIGVIAFVMPIAVVLLADRDYADLDSISISYWTHSHDIFVGSLIAVAFFYLHTMAQVTVGEILNIG